VKIQSHTRVHRIGKQKNFEKIRRTFCGLYAINLIQAIGDNSREASAGKIKHERRLFGRYNDNYAEQIHSFDIGEIEDTPAIIPIESTDIRH
jgi:hypothetical protein